MKYHIDDSGRRWIAEDELIPVVFTALKELIFRIEQLESEVFVDWRQEYPCG